MAARKGEAHHKAKLTEDEVREIRRIRAEEGLSCTKLAERIDWKVDTSTIHRIIRREGWSHVE